MIANAYEQYRNNSVMTATPAQLTLMLYNGAIKFCNQAIEAMDHKNIQGTHAAIIKTQNIISELQVTLDSKYSISREIALLYHFINELLVDANINKDKEKLVTAKEFITEFRDLWEETMKIAR